MVVFINDILIYSKSCEEHEEHLRQVLQILTEKQFFANLSECDFGPGEVIFLKHVISKHMIDVDPAKVEIFLPWEQLSKI